MSADQETVTTAGEPASPAEFPRTRAAALAAWEAFLPRAPRYAAERNGVRPGHRAVSRLSPAIRQRLVTEYELIASTLAAHPFARVEKFVQEILWRRYWKGWLELRPAVWTAYRAGVVRLREGLRGYQAKRVREIEAGQSGVEIMDHFARELKETGYLHNHARMWFAGFWVHTERLPWPLGADFFYRHLLDADPAANTLSWRWVAGLHTAGKTYLTRRSNLEKYLAPELLAAHPGGLEVFEDKLARPAPAVGESAGDGNGGELAVRPELPADAEEVTLPTELLSNAAARVGLWVHGDDLCVETAAPLAGLRPAGVFAGLSAGLLRDYSVSETRRAYLRDTLRDGLTRAGTHFGGNGDGGAETHYEEPESLPDALAAWAKGRELRAVAAMRPPVGPLLEVVPAVRAALARENVALHLPWRPEDAATLPFAQSGYFRFWQGARATLLAIGSNEDSGDEVVGAGESAASDDDGAERSRAIPSRRDPRQRRDRQGRKGGKRRSRR